MEKSKLTVMPKNKKNSEDSKTTETKWTALAVTPDTHKAVKVAAAQAGMPMGEFMARLSELARELAREIENESKP